MTYLQETFAVVYHDLFFNNF